MRQEEIQEAEAGIIPLTGILQNASCLEVKVRFFQPISLQRLKYPANISV